MNTTPPSAFCFSSFTFNAVGAAKLCFVGGVMITLLGVASLYAGNQAAKTNSYVLAHLNAIELHEKSGDYAAALSIARKLPQDSIPFSQRVEDLEKTFLKLGTTRQLFNEKGQPQLALSEVLNLVGIPILTGNKEPVVEINDWAQTNLLRRHERWDEQSKQFEHLKSKIYPLFAKLGFVNATSPHFKEYQGAIIHGGLLLRVRLRLNYLVEQWNQGVRFSDLYFLSGERPLDPVQEGEIEAATEYEMVQHVWNQSKIPKKMRNQLKVHFINAPMKQGKRPTTDDTVETWLQDSPTPGLYLAVTNAPYIYRQDAIVKTLAPENYSFDTIGPGATEEEPIAILLDELARSIFQTKKLLQK